MPPPASLSLLSLPPPLLASAFHACPASLSLLSLSPPTPCLCFPYLLRLLASAFHASPASLPRLSLLPPAPLPKCSYLFRLLVSAFLPPPPSCLGFPCLPRLLVSAFPASPRLLASVFLPPPPPCLCVLISPASLSRLSLSPPPPCLCLSISSASLCRRSCPPPPHFLCVPISSASLCRRSCLLLASAFPRIDLPPPPCFCDVFRPPLRRTCERRSVSPLYYIIVIIRLWFLEGRQNVHDDERSGRPVTATDNAAVAAVRNVVEADLRVTIDEIIIRLSPGIEIGRSSIGTIMSDVLNFRKVCARWVPRLLSENHKQQRMEAARAFLEMHRRDGDQLFSRIVTGDESWVHHSTPETKRQSMVWKKPEESAPKKAKVTISAGKVMAIVF
ncbi:hypothetical protein LAZ67_10001772 [Cordylochernes scorpioides]|uniref:Histone-lysine N-methyltransferase SETMAR n=1 Tax=Cordylochernes scorpioides TaxID=51811 RepID=A0ABY6KW47_9ARAC|nr:hypothetical protein LAZ67_10001772 [Cordylochernes scorpioides]